MTGESLGTIGRFLPRLEKVYLVSILLEEKGERGREGLLIYGFSIRIREEGYTLPLV